MDPLPALNSHEKIKIVTLTFLTIFCIFLEIILHFYLGISTGYTHIFYILLVLAAIWYQRKAVILALCLAVTHFSIGYFVFAEPLWVLFLRSAMFVVVTLLVGIMAEGLKKAEAAMCARSGEWELTFNSTSDGICLLDRDQKIQRCNRSMADMVKGIPFQDLIGKNCWEIVHKTTGPIMDCPFVVAKKTLTRHTAEVHEGDTWFEVTADPILDDSGAFAGAVHIMRDITGRKRVEEDIRLSNVIMNTQQEISPEGILVVDTSGKIISFNRRFTELWGISQEIIDSRSDERALSSILAKLSDPQEFLSRVRYLYEHQQEKSREEILLKDGKAFERYSAPMLGEDNRYFGRVWYFHDITERKRAETALRNSQQILEGILNTIPVRVFWKDRDLKYLGCNRPFAQDAGFTEPKDIIGKDDYAMGWKDQAEIYRSDDRGVIASGTAKVMIEEPQTTPDGRIIWILTSKVPLRDAAGKIFGVLGTYMDISEYRNAREAIRVSEEKYRAFFATSMDCVFITSKDGRFLDFNDETPAFFGYSDRKEIEMVNVRDLYSNARQREEHIRTIVQSGFVKDYPVDLRRKDGSVIHALVTSVARKDDSGNVIGFQGTIKDITEHRLAEVALRESERKFRDLFENSRDGIVLADIKTHKFVDSNEMFSLMLGYNSKEIRTLSVSDIHPEDCLSHILEVFEKMMKHEITIVENIPVKRKDGNIFYADISAYPVNISGKAYLAGVFRDITDRRKAEEVIAQSERKFHTMADYTVDWEYWLAPDSSFVYISPSCEKITGYSPKEFIADPLLITRIVHPDDALLVSDHFNTIHKNRTPGAIDFRIVGKDGEGYWLAHSCMPVYDRSGTYLGRRASNRDITDRKRAEEALRASEERFRGITERISDLIFVVDPEGYPIFMSPSVTSILGFPPESYIGKKAGPDIIHTEDIVKIGQAMEWLKNGSLEEQVEFRMLKRDGSYALFDGTGIPVFTHGIYSGVQIVARDITERRRAEEALRMSEEKYRLFTEKSNDIIYSMDPAGNITYVSPQVSRYGYTPEEIISGGLSSVILTEDLPGVLEDTRITLSTGKSTATIFRIRDKSGAIVWLEDNDTGVFDSSGKLMVVFGIIRDITERKRSEAALKESNERYISFIKEAAMRLKTPVEVVERNINGVIKDINTGDIDNAQVLLQLQIQVKNMEQIRQNILDLNKTIVDGYGEISPASKKFLTE